MSDLSSTSPAAAQPVPRAYPEIPARFAIPYVAGSVLVMAFSALFSVVPILVFLALWMRYVIYRGVFMLRPTPSVIVTVLLPFLACYSFFWSARPGHSLYAGLEFVAMAVCAAIIGRAVDMRDFARGVALGIAIALVITFADGTYTVDYETGKSALTGLFGSKNQVGLIASIGIYTSITLLLSSIGWRQKLLFGLLPLALCLPALYLSHSATSVASLGLVFAAAGALLCLSRIQAGWRGAALALGLFAVATAAVLLAAVGADITGPVLDAFGKSPTLTGRTYLWAEGLRNGMEHPLLGHGYTAFWVEGNGPAEHYWEKFHIPGKSGFHFHNLFVQAFVDLGAAGASIVVALLATALIMSARATWQRADLGAFFTFGIAFIFVVRAMVEVDLMGPFGLGPLLFLPLIPRLAADRLRQAPAR